MTLYSRKQAYLMLGILSSPIILGGFAVLIKGGPVSIFVISAGALSFAYVWLFSFKLELNSKYLSYRSLLGGTKTLKRSSIIDARGIRAGERSYFRIAIDNTDGPPLIINGGVFNSEELGQFLRECSKKTK